MSSQDFYLNQLNVDASGTSALMAGVASGSFDASCNTMVDVSLNTLKSLFRYKTDNIEITNASGDDIEYLVLYVEPSFNSTDPSTYPLLIDINANTHVIFAGGHIAFDSYDVSINDTITYDYSRYLAKQLFNHPRGVDLFSNEVELRESLRDNFALNFDLVLQTLYGYGVLNAASSDPNPAKTLLDQIIQNDPARLQDISVSGNGFYDVSGNYDANGNWFKMPLIANDKIYMLLTVKAPPNQHTLTNTNPIPDRTYRIQIRAVE